MIKCRFFSVPATVFVSALLSLGCDKTLPPNTPAAPSGPSSGGVGVPYSFSSSAVDPDGDNIAIRFDWGDGDTSDWSLLVASGDTASARHAWTATGTYLVKAQAKNLNNAVSDWSGSSGIVISPGWFRTHGGTGDDVGMSARQTSDGGYIIAGYTLSYGEGGRDVHLVRTDSVGDTLWTRTFGGSADDIGRSVGQTTDGGFVVVGATSSFGSGMQAWLVKVAVDGSRQWDYLFGYGSEDDDGISVQPTSDGGSIFVGSTSAYGGDVLLVKTDALGNKQWSDTKGYSDSREEGNAVRQTSDGGYIVVGTTWRYDIVGDVWLLKVGADGSTTWHTHIGGPHGDLGRSVCPTADGGHIIAGLTASYGAGGVDVYLIKTDAGGNVLWMKTFGGASTDIGESVQQTADGGYIIAGTTKTDSTGTDAYLIKTDGTGSLLWERTFGGSAGDVAMTVQQTADGGYVIGGHSNSFGAGDWDFYLVKTDAEGNSLP
ncbi:MAG: PKD domain-containing protein [bacterium]